MEVDSLVVAPLTVYGGAFLSIPFVCTGAWQGEFEAFMNRTRVFMPFVDSVTFASFVNQSSRTAFEEEIARYHGQNTSDACIK